MVTETTITQFEGWDLNFKLNCKREGLVQYAGCIDELHKISGGKQRGYSNDWPARATKDSEIRQLELGLQAHTLWRTKDGVLDRIELGARPRRCSRKIPRHFDSRLIKRGRRTRGRGAGMNCSRNTRTDRRRSSEKMRATTQHRPATRKKPTSARCGGHVLDPARLQEWDWQPYYPG